MKANLSLRADPAPMMAVHPPTSPRDRLPSWHVGEFGWIWIATAVLFAVSAVVAPGTLSRGSLYAMLPFAGILALVATGQTLVIQQRGLDMSSIGTVALAGLLVAKYGNATGSIALALVIAFGVAALIGIANGVLTSRVHITPLVATLAVNAIVIGAVREISGSTPISVPQGIQDFSHASIAGLPLTVWLAALFIVVLYVVTRRTVIGRRFVAVGVNPRTAVACGIVAPRYQIGAYVVSAVCFAVAGVLLAGYIGNATHTAGNDYLMPAIAAVVVGGTPFTGGRGSVIASGVAALFLAQLSQMVLALGAGPAIQLLVQALALLVATAIRLLPGILKRG
ncbi:MAG TPA: ABC transporter permease [Variovorax sp.]